jgi:hypothetical protein
VADEADEMERIRREQEAELTKLIAADIREAWVQNTLIWIGVVGGSLLVVLGLLVFVTGG